MRTHVKNEWEGIQFPTNQNRDNVEHTLVRRGRVGLFTVGKKDGRLRLVFDSRWTNMLFKDPPWTALSTPGALEELSLYDSLSPGVGRSYVGSVGAIDLVDSFYQFRTLRLASYFALDASLAAADAGVEQAWVEDDMAYQSVSPDTWLVPCLSTLPMG